jgi:hypothetical protein
MILAITIKEMPLLNIACKRVLGDEEWARRFTVAWESLRGQGLVTADMLESAILDGVNIKTNIHFDREEAQKLRELAEYCMRGFMGEHAHTVKMILARVPR